MLLTDDRGEPVRVARPPRRIVSLVPSDTYTLLRLGAGDRLVGRTQYCVEPAGDVASIPTVGGTKDPDLERVFDLAPDLVVMNREENRRRDWERIVDRGVAVLATCPMKMTEGAAQVARLARLLGALDARTKDLVRLAYEFTKRAAPSARRVRVFVPIWMDPLMTANQDTFLSDALATAGGDNVFGDRVRRFPLAADLGRGPEFAPERAEGRDTRYPRVTLEEVRERAPQAVLLPDEPFAFGEEHAALFRDVGAPSLHPGAVRFVAGKWLMWHGLMSLEHHEHVRGLLDDVARVASQERES